MSANSKIEWTETTWNPVTGCTKVSPGCDNCYALTMHERFHGKGSFAIVNRSDDKLYLPFKWRKPRRVFVNSMSDLFHDDVPDSFIANVWSVMARTPQHTYQVLTKRHGRMRALLNSPTFRAAALGAARSWPWPLPNVWLGVSVEDQKWADIRIPALIGTPAAVRWLSCEPLLGPIDLARWLRPKPDCGFVDRHDGLCAHPRAATPECFIGSDCPLTGNTYGGIDWVVAGGESGLRSRPMLPSWPREMRDTCERFGVPFFFKQWGNWAPLVPGLWPGAEIRAYPGALVQRVGKKTAGRELDGRTHDAYPLAVTV